MPTIYSSLYQQFIRQGLTKSVTHGYAQSVVAATHPHLLNSQNRPSFAKRNSNRVSRLHTLQLKNAFHTERQTSGLNTTHDHIHDRGLGHGGLDAYFEALKQKRDETAEHSEEALEEWSQFEFQKQIEWKPSPASILLGEARPVIDDDCAIIDENGDDVNTPPGRYSPADEAALAHIDAALHREIDARSRQESLGEVSDHSAAASPKAPSSVATSGVQSCHDQRSRSPTRPRAPLVDAQAVAYADHLLGLSKAGRYLEIPAVFEAMLVAKIRPLASAYNALLMAAMHIPTDKSEVLSKSLEVYTDMLRRRVAPDNDTYDILVGLLCTRSLEVSGKKAELETKRVRFGGMEKAGKFMFASHELEEAILSEDDRLDLAIKLFTESLGTCRASYSSETYNQLISACAASGRLSDMLKAFEHMESQNITPYASMFPQMIIAYGSNGDLTSAVDCYNEYKQLAIRKDAGDETLVGRQDSEVYAAVIYSYIVANKPESAIVFYRKIVELHGADGAQIQDVLINSGLVKAFVDRGSFDQALEWAQGIKSATRGDAMAKIALAAADRNERNTALAAFGNIPGSHGKIVAPAAAMLALSIRSGDVSSAMKYWQILSRPDIKATADMIEPTAMFAVAMIGSGQVAEGLTQAELMFERIKAAQSESRPDLADEIEEGVHFIAHYMRSRGVVDTRNVQPVSLMPNAPVQLVASSFEDSFDPYAHNTDFKGSALISEELEGTHGRRAPHMAEAMTRFYNMRRAGRHPRYITYAKLISAASREGNMGLCLEIMNMAHTDIPLQSQYATVRYGWSSILDAMVGASLYIGDRLGAEEYHQKLLEIGATPSANTYGLYITTLKESTKTFDEASEAVKIFHRAKSEGVEPSSFLYNALIGKLGKARRIDDCLLYFSEMRALGIKPTSVTYGTIVNALCRVSDEKFAEELFDEMESMPNYKARPAPYNSMMQFFLTTKHNKAKVLAYYERMLSKGIVPTSHTYKLLIDTHATLDPLDFSSAEAVLDDMRAAGVKPEPIHYASLIHARGCVMHDVDGARSVFDSVMADLSVASNASLFQALFEGLVANHRVAETEPLLGMMKKRQVPLTPYIANTLIHGWAAANKIERARAIFEAVGRDKCEPSTYEAMTRAYLAVEKRDEAGEIVNEMMSRGYPSAVVNKVLELMG
ncbi:Pentatricopeptide repeat-containing protein 5, mitochondrial [Ceratocystis lukuohia]|uniref:Pentatricopeptide repeat-containing protein 5, mitochondrial n=1 Tax=Ceratocystis lukuohia TaxID=2019550 RepID=A0ABR4MGX9_9PEZI